MLNRRHILALLLALPLLVAGCKINTINSFPTNVAHVRIMNAMPNAGPINVTVDGNAVWSALAFEATTAYTDFNNTQQHVFNVNLVGSTSTLVTATFNLAGTASYTLLAFGPVDAPFLSLMPDDTSAPGSGNFLIRVADVADAAGAIDFYLTIPGVPLDNIAPNLSGILYGSSTGFVQFQGGTYELRFTQNATKNVIYDSGTQSLAAGATIDTIAYTRSGGQLANVSLAYVTGAQQSVILNSTLAEIKIFNAAFQTGAVNGFLDGGTTPLFSSLAYPAATGYNLMPSGQHTLTFEAVTTPGATIASAAPNLASATDSTLLLSGFPGALTTVLFNDFNFQPLTNNTRLRVINASPDAPPVTLLLNTTQQFTGLAYLSASNYLEFLGSDYTLTINDPNGQTLLTLPNLTLSAAETNTLYLSGPAAAMTGTLVQDN